MTRNHAAGSYLVLVVTIGQINAAVIVLFHQLVRSFFFYYVFKERGIFASFEQKHFGTFEFQGSLFL